MKRIEFLRALGIGAAAIVVPSILLNEVKDPVINATVLKARRKGFSTANMWFNLDELKAYEKFMLDRERMMLLGEVEESLDKKLIKTYKNQDLTGFLRQINRR